MLIYGLLLTTSMAVSLRRDLSLPFSRITIVILLYSSLLNFFSLYLNNFKVMCLYGELLYSTCNLYIFYLLFYVILVAILILREFYSKDLIKQDYYYSQILYINIISAQRFRYIFNPPKPHKYVSLVKKKNIKDFFTVIIGGMVVTIPNCYLSIVKNFGVGFLLGIPLFVNLVAYINTDNISMENLQENLQVIVTDLNRMLPQLSNFIDQFHNYINQNGINVITNAQGSLDIDLPNNINDSTAHQYANRINIFDNLIRHHIDTIEDLLERGLVIEDQIRELNNNYVSQLMEGNNRLKNLIESYKHYKKN